MKIHKSARASLRIDPNNQDHHLYNNNGTWWVHYTIYPDRVSAQRIRHSLETACVITARRRRNLLFETLFPDPARSRLQVHFFPSPAQIHRIENLALDLCERLPADLIEIYNSLAREGLRGVPAQWIQLSALRLALRHHFADPVVQFEDGLLFAPCLVDLRQDGTLLKYPFEPCEVMSPASVQ